MRPMKQKILNLNLSLKKTRKQVFLEKTDQVVLWVSLVELTAPYYPQGRTDRPAVSWPGKWSLPQATSWWSGGW